MQDFPYALARLSRDHLRPYRITQHLGTRQGGPVGALAGLEPLEIINLIPLIDLSGVVIDGLAQKSVTTAGQMRGTKTQHRTLNTKSFKRGNKKV